METHCVRAVFELDCVWADSLPSYRIYVNDEMFTERTWSWPSNLCIDQTLQIQAPMGEYTVTVTPVGNSKCEFVTRNCRIEHGPARWQDNHKIIIQS
jgi:hypothetical protein